MMRKFTSLTFLLIGLSLFACQPSVSDKSSTTQQPIADTTTLESIPTDNKAQEILKKTIEKHGGDAYQKLQVRFDFRDKQYQLSHQEGIFKYERIFKEDSTQKSIHDVLTNEGFTRKVNGKPITLSTKKKNAYQNSVNSVIYFTLLPHGLLAPAVLHRYLGTDTLKNTPYHQIQVTFQQEGGGEDYQDVYVYWINAQDFTLDFFAYSYEVNGGGIRFREVFQRKKVGQVLFQDYYNYEVPLQTALPSIGKLWESQQLKKLSEIENKNIQLIP